MCCAEIPDSCLSRTHRLGVGGEWECSGLTRPIRVGERLTICGMTASRHGTEETVD